MADLRERLKALVKEWRYRWPEQEWVGYCTSEIEVALMDSESGARWVCSNCGNTEYRERDVLCWKCGKGEMRFIAESESDPHASHGPDCCWRCADDEVRREREADGERAEKAEALLREALEQGAREERRACHQIAGDCERERVRQMVGMDDFGRGDCVEAKATEAGRIADRIAARGPMSEGGGE